MRGEQGYSINPGRLRRQITIEQPPATQDATGARYGEWTAFAANVGAEIVPMGGKEAAGAESFQAQAAYRITIRYLAGLDTTMRVNWGGRLFDVVNVNDIEERNRVMELTCVEGRSHGV